MGAILYEWLGHIGALFSAERDRWPLWAPVCVGFGVGLYFALGAEPWVWTAPALLAVLLVGAWGGRGQVLVWLPLIGLALAALGFCAAQHRAITAAAPVLERPSGRVTVTGWVAEVEPAPDGGARVTLTGVEGVAPTKIRVRFKKSQPPAQVGTRVTLPVVLIPPPGASMPGALDFRLKAWFLGLGAVGTALGPAEIVEDAPDPSGLFWSALRQTVAQRVRAVLPGPEGGEAVAILTGNSSSVPPEILSDFRDSGLAHILVIAGLHMGLASGFVFLVVRGGLALIPRIALAWPIKKWAALAALGVTGFYLLLAGMPLPATRAFVMAALVLAAVMMDRQVQPMRLLAFAALVILLTRPDQLAGPSFQMSFAAVATLIATYEVLGPWLAGMRRSHGGPLAWILHHVGGLALTSFAAGTATTAFGMYHFGRVAVWQVAANLVAVPVTGVMVMPFAVLTLLLMPFGAEALALVPLGWGLSVVTWIGHGVAGWPGSHVAVAVMPPWGLLAISLGGLWLCLWRRRWRLWGLAGLVIGFGSLALARPPDLLVDPHAAAFGVRMADGSLLISKGGRMQRDVWGRRAGPASAERWPKSGRSLDGRLSCDVGGCLYRLGGRVAALVTDEDQLDAACHGADVVIAAVPVRSACRGAVAVIDRFDVWRRGAHAVWLAPGGVRVESAADWSGDRLWSPAPRPRFVRVEEEGGDDQEP